MYLHENRFEGDRYPCESLTGLPSHLDAQPACRVQRATQRQDIKECPIHTNIGCSDGFKAIPNYHIKSCSKGNTKLEKTLSNDATMYDFTEDQELSRGPLKAHQDFVHTCKHGLACHVKARADVLGITLTAATRMLACSARRRAKLHRQSFSADAERQAANRCQRLLSLRYLRRCYNQKYTDLLGVLTESESPKGLAAKSAET